MSPSNFNAIDLIFAELRKAEKKHPYWPEDPVHAAGILMEEAGEAMKAANDVKWSSGSVGHLRNEVAQTAAMCIRWLCYIDQHGIPQPEIEEPPDHTDDICPCGNPDCMRPTNHGGPRT